MLEQVRARLRALARRLRRLERRELDAFVRWIEHTGNLLHLSILVFVPLLIAAVTWLANMTAAISFLLFPPLASGTYTLFANPEGKYAMPWTFVGGMTVGALCGWLAVALAAAIGLDGGGASASGAALGVFFTGVCTWALDLEVPTAFSTALLVLVTGNAQLAYVLGIVVSSAFVASAFVLWRDRFYEQRARYLYQTTSGDDHVLVPMDDCEETVARFAASIAGAHDAGKVVLFDVIDEAEAEQRRDEPSTSERQDETSPTERAASDAARHLESLAADLEMAYDVPCEVVVAADSGERPFGSRSSSERGSDGGLSAGLTLQTARQQNCDLIVAPYAERESGGLSSFITGLFDSEIDVIAFHSNGTPRRRWRDSLVAVRGAGDTARAMLDFAIRVTEAGRPVSVLTCIDSESRRRTAEGTLADLVDAFSGRFETHVATASVESYLSRAAPGMTSASSARAPIARLPRGSSPRRRFGSSATSRPTWRSSTAVDIDSVRTFVNGTENR